MKKIERRKRREFARKELVDFLKYHNKNSFKISNPIHVHAESTSNFNRTFKIYLSREAVPIFSNRFYSTVCRIESGKYLCVVPEQPALSSWVLAFNLQKLLNFIGFSFNSFKI
jgi:hypothetical protein